jgi:hypothetical protein
MSFLLNPTTAAPSIPKANEPASPLALLPANEPEAQRFIKKYRKEGWLWKLDVRKRTRKAKKYFRIADSNLHWYRNPTVKIEVLVFFNYPLSSLLFLASG